MQKIIALFWNKEQARVRAGWRLALQLVMMQLIQDGLLFLVSRFVTVPPLSGTAPLWLFPVLSGAILAASLLSVWLAGMMAIGSLLVLAWVRWRYGHISLHTPELITRPL